MSSRNQQPIPPWMVRKRPRNADSPCPENIEKHQEILSFVRYISLNSEQKAQRNEIVESIRKVIRQLYATAEVHIYGSFETELCLPQSDIDLVVFGTDLGSEEPNLGGLFKVAGCIQEADISESFPSVISSARVPIIKFKDKKSGILVDMSFECKSALESTELIKKYVKWYPMLRPLTLVLKYYLKQRYLNENWTGGIGSYTLVVMVLSFLQLHTPSRGRSPKPADGEDLSTLMINFLQFYGSQFDYFSNVISVLNGGSYLRKADKNWVSEVAPEALSVEDPTNVSSDLAAGSYRIKDAREVFMEGFFNLTSSSSKRWAHTHSFLVRLFETGAPTPTTSSTASSPRSPTRSLIADNHASQTLHNGFVAPLSPTEAEATNRQQHISMLGILPPTSSSSSSSYASSTSTTLQIALPAQQQTEKAPHLHTSTAVVPTAASTTQSGAPKSPTKRNGSRDNRSRNQQNSKPAGSPGTVSSPPKQSSPNNKSSSRRTGVAPTTSEQKSPRRVLFMDPAAPEYQPLFPPLPTKASSGPNVAQDSIAQSGLESVSLGPSADQISGITNAS